MARAPDAPTLFSVTLHPQLIIVSGMHMTRKEKPTVHGLSVKTALFREEGLEPDRTFPYRPCLLHTYIF